MSGTTPVVGIVGGGQLARMTLEAASALALDVRVLIQPSEESAAAVWPAVTVGDFNEPGVLESFAASCDVLTFDHELVDPDAVARLEGLGHVARPGSATLRYSDKVAQRTAFREWQLPVPPFAVTHTLADVVAAADRLGGWPMVLKPARGGYDGRGVHVVGGLREASDVLCGVDGPVVAEPLLPIDRELAVVVARSSTGETTTYPVAETVQLDGMCRLVSAPAPVPDALAEDARSLATRIAHLTGGVGVMAVEFFLVGEALVINEIAPRPHNSGHFTIEACATSQFENHLRAILGWPLGDTRLVAPAAAMANVIASGRHDPRDRRSLALTVSGAHVHLYGKSPAAGRKVGHVTALADDRGAAVACAQRAAHLLSGPSPVPRTKEQSPT